MSDKVLSSIFGLQQMLVVEYVSQQYDFNMINLSVLGQVINW